MMNHHRNLEAFDSSSFLLLEEFIRLIYTHSSFDLIELAEIITVLNIVQESRQML